MFRVTRDDATGISRIHIENCPQTGKRWVKYTTMGEAMGGAWHNGKYCVRFCSACRPLGRSGCGCQRMRHL